MCVKAACQKPLKDIKMNRRSLGSHGVHSLVGDGVGKIAKYNVNQVEKDLES